MCLLAGVRGVAGAVPVSVPVPAGPAWLSLLSVTATSDAVVESHSRCPEDTCKGPAAVLLRVVVVLVALLVGDPSVVLAALSAFGEWVCVHTPFPQIFVPHCLSSVHVSPTSLGKQYVYGQRCHARPAQDNPHCMTKQQKALDTHAHEYVPTRRHERLVFERMGRGHVF
jgi:hypothetical protein